jgi:hypothetical protein
MRLIRLCSGVFLAVTITASIAPVSTASASELGDVVGQTYSKAKKALREEGYKTFTLATRVGDGEDLFNCIVANVWTAPFVRGTGDSFRHAKSTELMVALNCNASVATAGEAGYSAASPVGQAALAAQKAKAEAAAAKKQQAKAEAKAAAAAAAAAATG